MANRQFHLDSKSASAGLVYIDFSALTNGASDLVMTTPEDGSQTRGSGVKSVTHTATGKYLVTLSDAYRWIVAKTADLDEAAAPGDGAFCTMGTVLNEGTANPVTFILYTRSVTGTLTDFTGRRVSLQVCLKNSKVGV